MSNFEEMCIELTKAYQRAERAKNTIGSNVRKVADGKRMLKSSTPWETIEREIATVSRANAGVRLDQQRSAVGQIMIKSMTAFNEGKITSQQVAQIEAHVLRLDGQFEVLTKSLQQFDTISTAIKNIRAQGQELAKQAADQTKAKLDSILKSIADMQSNLDLSLTEADKLRKMAEGSK